MNTSITICIVNYNTSDFIINTLYCLEKLTKNNYRVLIRDNNSKIEDFLNLKKNIKNFSNVELYRVINFKEKGSMAHGLALNDLVPKISTKYGVIMDPDFSFLHKEWDELLIKEINEEYPIIGTPPGFKNSPTQKPTDFPCVYAIFFDNEIMKKFQIDFRPNFGYNELVTNKDTGYQLREVFLKKGYKAKLFKVINSLDYKLSTYRKIHCSEFYLEGYKKIFGSHFVGSATLGRYKYISFVSKRMIFSMIFSIEGWKMLFYSMPIIGNHFLRFKGKRQKKKWIKICKKIVDNNL